ncbi:MAG: FecR family protein [Myxococcota bacterium]|nr:FecR family protein [Myxococcota bacterium]
MSSNSRRPPDVLGAWAALGDASRTAAPGRRERMVESIASAMREARARQVRRGRASRFALVLASAAGLVLVVALWRGRAVSEAPVARLYTLVGASQARIGGHVLPSLAASAPLSLAARAEVETESASTCRLELVSGVEVAVGPETRLRLPDARRPSSTSDEMAMEGGFIRVDVPKLRGGASFAIRTPNTLVVVHGTSFSVEVSKASPASVSRTKVVVTEGIVTVQQGSQNLLLGAGTQWTSEALPDASGASPLASALAPISPTDDAPQGMDTAARSASAAGQTELAGQNRLFAHAMKAKERGDSVRALRLLGDFFQRHPDAPLAQDARVEQFRLLAATGSHEAALRAARAYLSLYPNGFAHDEARRLTEVGGDAARGSASQHPR